MPQPLMLRAPPVPAAWSSLLLFLFLKTKSMLPFGRKRVRMIKCDRFCTKPHSQIPLGLLISEQRILWVTVATTLSRNLLQETGWTALNQGCIHPPRTPDITLASFGTSKPSTNPHAPQHAEVPQFHIESVILAGLRPVLWDMDKDSLLLRGLQAWQACMGSLCKGAFNETDARLWMIKIYMNLNFLDKLNYRSPLRSLKHHVISPDSGNSWPLCHCELRKCYENDTAPSLHCFSTSSSICCSSLQESM